MYSTNPHFEKKPSLLKKASTKIHFNANIEDKADETDSSLVEQKLKRQQQMLEEQKHEKIIKKAKIDGHLQNQHAAYSNGIRNNSQPNYQSLNQSNPKRSPRLQQDQTIIQKKSLQLLNELLFHPQINEQALINPEVANKWILQPTTPIKIKSFLALYMILHQFNRVQFSFKRSINLDGPEFKTIEIQKANNNLNFKDQNIQSTDQYKKYQQNEFKKYLTGYLEWLIWVNQHNFQTTPGDLQFWAMAHNNCQKISMQLLRSTNHRQMAKNYLLASFLMNAEDFVFRSTSELPRTKNILYMNDENLQVLPACHWVLGLNFSVKYFYQKPLNERISESLINIDRTELGQFYQQYQMLSSFYLKRNGPCDNSRLSDGILGWLGMNSGCWQIEESNREFRFNLIRRICCSLLGEALSNKKDIKHVQDKIYLSVQLLEKDIILSGNQKDQLLSSILYENQKIAYGLGKQFPLVMSKLEHMKQPTLTNFSQRFNNEYNELYSHLIMSEHPAIQNDLLTQLKHLTNISFKRQTQFVIDKIAKISSSFTLLTHWNKDVLKTFVFIIDKYLQRINQFIHPSVIISSDNSNDMMMEAEEKQVKIQDQSRNKQMTELKALCIFLKIHLNLESLNLINLMQIIKLVQQAQTSRSQLPFELRTISFIKKNMLGILFAKNGFNQALLLQIKKNSKHGQLKKAQKMSDQPQIKAQNILEKLKKMAQGTKYFEDQINMLTGEANYI